LKNSGDAILNSMNKKFSMVFQELKVPISADEIIEAVKKMKKSDREAFVEDLLAILLLSIYRALKKQGQTTRQAKQNPTKGFLEKEL